MIEEILKHFSTQPRLLFITVRGSGRWQKIGKVSDLLKRVSSNYFIVREKDKKGDGYHFHSLVSTNKDIKPNWYRKGIHIHVVPVGDKKVRLPLIPQDEEEMLHLKYGDTIPEGIDKILIDGMLNLYSKDRIRHGRTVKNTHLARVVTYMFKELTIPQQYTNYLYKRRGLFVAGEFPAPPERREMNPVPEQLSPPCIPIANPIVTP